MISFCSDRIKSTIFIIIIIAFGLILPSCSSNNTDIENYFYSVFELNCTEEGRVDSIGTAFKGDGGYVYTNAHVVTYSQGQGREIYETITAFVYNTDKTISLNVIGYDYEKDIAVLKPEQTSDIYNSLAKLDFADSDKLEIGQSVFTVNNLNGYGLAFNKGYVSAKPKKIERNGSENYYLQTSIEISKGSSGAPVLNEKGIVTGMMTFKLRDTNSEYVDGASFMIPSNIIKEYVNSIVTDSILHSL